MSDLFLAYCTLHRAHFSGTTSKLGVGRTFFFQKRDTPSEGLMFGDSSTERIGAGTLLSTSRDRTMNAKWSSEPTKSV